MDGRFASYRGGSARRGGEEQKQTKAAHEISHAATPGFIFRKRKLASTNLMARPPRAY
jgi:hypothetical protein